MLSILAGPVLGAVIPLVSRVLRLSNLAPKMSEKHILKVECAPL
jgi:hypothetical protein